MENIGTRMCALKFGIAQCRVVMCGRYWCMSVHTKFSIARCGLSGTCIIPVHSVCARIIMEHVVCIVLVEHSKSISGHTTVLLNVCAEYWCAVGHTKIWHGEAHRIKCAWNNNAR